MHSPAQHSHTTPSVLLLNNEHKKQEELLLVTVYSMVAFHTLRHVDVTTWMFMVPLILNLVGSSIVIITSLLTNSE